MTDTSDLGRAALARRYYHHVLHGGQLSAENVSEMVQTIEALEAENARLTDVLLAIEIMTATGDGLTPSETIEIHVLAAEGRYDDPAAWRADPAVIARLRLAIRELKGGDE